jgi:8-oxo-dGTP diphosphatase
MTASRRSRGVVAVIPRAGRLLVIRRSQFVRRPGAYCFPGGGIESGESEQEALVREMHEELNAVVLPQQRVWTSTTPWDVDLAWWLAELADHSPLQPNAAEVESVRWLQPTELWKLADLLESNLAFLDAWQRGDFVLPLDKPWN